MGDNVVTMVADGRTYVPDRENATEEALREVRREKALKKRHELEAGLKVSLRDGVLETFEYNTKMKAIASNMDLIENAIDDPVKLTEL